MTLILNNQNVRDLITIDEVIDVLEFAYKELAEGRGALRRWPRWSIAKSRNDSLKISDVF